MSERSPQDAGAGADAPPIVPIELRPTAATGPIGEGLAAWQRFYQEAPRQAGMIDMGAPGFAWWFRDPEILTLYEEEYPRQLELMRAEFAERRAREQDPTQVDPGSRALRRNLERYHDQLEAMGFDLASILAQDPRSDVARHLSNHLVIQARDAADGHSAFGLEDIPRYRFNMPLELVVQQATGEDLRTWPPSRVDHLLQEYTDAIFDAALIRADMQLYQAARIQAASALGVLPFSPSTEGAPFHAEFLELRAVLDQRWEAFLAEVRVE